MKKENIIETLENDHANLIDENSLMSEELQKAIQNLIYRLRELGPLSN
ncbi:MAG: hypothetical protein JO149_01790 [Gammaproteobacteria bacterium]|nr:hypothetical protein [Gammaproteobacteria bacterium]